LLATSVDASIAMLPANLIEEIASNTVLEQAYRWLCERRKNDSSNNDVWDLRWRWREIKS